LFGWGGQVDPDLNLTPAFQTGGRFNYPKYSNPQVDKLLAQARTVPDQTMRMALYQQCQQIIADDLPQVFLYANAGYQLNSRKVQNYTVVADRIMRFAEVWLDQ